MSEVDEAEIRRLREYSNRSIARRNVAGVGDSLDAEYVGVIGDGTFVGSREMYLKLFKQGFNAKDGLKYERSPESIEVSACAPLAAEHGSWVATQGDGDVVFRGSYSAMWRKGTAGWKIRSEIFVTLA